MNSRRSFFSRLGAMAAVVALAPSIAFGRKLVVKEESKPEPTAEERWTYAFFYQSSANQTPAKWETLDEIPNLKINKVSYENINGVWHKNGNPVSRADGCGSVTQCTARTLSEDELKSVFVPKAEHAS